MAKPGPKTEAGKAVVRLNAVQHGVLSITPVIPGLERQEDWEAHRAGLLASLAPEGHLEIALAERVALQLWRLHRVARYETESIALAQERVEDDVARQRRFDSVPMRSSLGSTLPTPDLLKFFPTLEPLKADREPTDLARMRRERLLPQASILEKIVRYEAHLNRQLYQALHELEALQARRQGDAAPLARVDVQGLPAGGHGP